MSENSGQKRKFLIRGVSKKQLQQIKNGKLPLSFFMGFVSGINISAFIPNRSDKSSTNIDGDKENNSDELNEDTTEECIDIEIPTTMEFASGINDEMSFKDAYEAARNDVGDEGFFNWKGNSYHTLTKEEWDSLSEEDRAMISKKIQENSSFEFTKVIEDDTDKDDENADFEFEDDYENENEEIPDDEKIEEITIDDLIPDEEDNEDYEYVELDDFAETDDIISGLNDGEAEEDEFNSAENIADNSETDDFLKKINEFENNNEDSDDFA